MAEVSPHQHDAGDPASVRVLLVTVSDSRSPAEDESGRALRELFIAAGHQVVDQRVIPDDPAVIAGILDRLLPDSGADAAVLTGGTGITARDGTYEVVSARLDKRLDGFGELFRALSFEQVGARAMLSRAVAGLCGGRPVFALPGSRRAAVLGAERLILPVLGHLVGQARR